MKWTVEADLPVQLALIHVDGVHVTEEPSAFNELCRCAERYAKEFEGRSPGDVPGVQTARRLFRDIGIDPTKHRPSSEALLRRALKGLAFHRINTLVDVGNWCSLDFLLPICIYDSDKIVGDVEVRKGREGESYIGLNRRDVHAEGRFTVTDDEGPFGSPMTDSQRTAITLETTRTALGLFAPTGYDMGLLRRNAELFADRVREICGGTVTSLDLLR